MKKSYVYIIGSLLVGVAAVFPAHAQQVVTAEARTVATVPGNALSRPVTVHVERVSLKQAIDAIAERAAVRIQYQGNVLDAVAAPVTVHADQRPLAAVLEDVLKGTRLQVVVSAPDALTIKTVVPAIQGTLAGKVLHAKTRQPVAGATVSIGGTNTTTITDVEGRFRFERPAGEYTLHVRSVGYRPQSRTVTVADEGTVSVDVLMDPGTSVLDEVVVTGTVIATERKAITTPITVITAQDIEQRGITRVEQLLRGEVPGVFVLETGSAAYGEKLGAMNTSTAYSRGSSSLSLDVNNKTPTPLKTFVDGIELLDATYLGTIDPRSIERIEIITGPQAATIYGSGAMGGVMQIFTKRGNGATRPELTLNLQYGMMENNVSTGRAPVHAHSANLTGGTGPAFSYAASLSYDFSGQWRPDFFSRRSGASIGVTHVAGPVTVTGNLSTTRSTNGTGGGPNGTIGLWELASQGMRPVLNGAGYMFPQRLSRSSSQTVALNANYQPVPFWSHRVSVGRNSTDFTLDPQTPIYAFRSDSLYTIQESHGARTTLGYNSTIQSPRLGIFATTLTLGANGAFGKQATYSGELVSESATTFQSPSVTRTETSDSWGVFTNWQLALFDRLYLTLGLRGERNPNYGERHKVDWTPTNGIAYTTEIGNLTIKALASYGSATRAPSSSMRLVGIVNTVAYLPSQVIRQFAAPALTPEYERGPQGGLELYYGNRGSLTINRYRQIVTDLIQNMTVDSIEQIRLADGGTRWYPQTQYRNVATIRKHGWEATGTANIAVLHLKGTYSWNDSRILRLGWGETGIGMPFRYIPTHTGNVTASFARDGTSVSLVTNWVGRRRQNVIDSPYYQQYYGSSTRLPMYAGAVSSVPADWDRPGYMKSDLSVSQQLAPWASATMNVTNLANSFGSEVSVLQIVQGRQTRIGVRLRMR